MQLDVLPSQDPRELEPHMAHPEDRHRRNHRQWLEQQLHLAATTLNPMLVRRFVRQRDLENLRLNNPRPDHRAGPLNGKRLQIAAADRGPSPFRGDHHLGAGLPRSMPSNRHHGDQHPRLPL
jgi:hypothetical protein